MRATRLLVVLTGLTALVAIAALAAILLQAPRLSNVEKRIHEVREKVVTLHVPPGAHVHVTTVVRKGVMPGKPEVKAHVRVPTPGG